MTSEASRLAELLLHLEMNPKELRRYKDDREAARAELAHFGLSRKTIDVVLNGDLLAFGMLFRRSIAIHTQVGHVVMAAARKWRKKK